MTIIAHEDYKTNYDVYFHLAMKSTVEDLKSLMLKINEDKRELEEDYNQNKKRLNLTWVAAFNAINQKERELCDH